MNGPPRVVVCDDHHLFAEALSHVLAANGFSVVGRTAHPQEAVALVLCTRAELCTMDHSFPDGNGIDAARDVIIRAPTCRVLMLAAAAPPDEVARAIDVGVTGFLNKSADIAAVVHAAHRLLSGEVVIDPTLLREAVEAQRRDAHRGDLLVHLTPRELEVLQSLVDGEPTEGIAQSMDVATTTARSHIQSVLVKLGVHSRLEAAAYATRCGMTVSTEQRARGRSVS